MKMSEEIKNKIREHLSTDYGKCMLKRFGLSYVKKEIFHSRKNYTLGDKREQKVY